MPKAIFRLLFLLPLLVLNVKGQFIITGVPAQWNVANSYILVLNGGFAPFYIWISDAQGNRLEFLANNTFLLDPDISLSPSPPLALGGQYFITAIDDTGSPAQSPLFELISSPVGPSMSTTTTSCLSYPVSTRTVTVTSSNSGLFGASTSTCPTFSCTSASSASMLTVTRITQTETQTVFTTQNDTKTKNDKTTITLTSTSTRTKEVTSTVTVTATKTKG